MIGLYSLTLKILRWSLPLLRLIPHPKVQYFLKNHSRVHGELSSRPLWIHASSGEIEYAKSVIRRLKERHPTVPLLVTHTSLSSRKALESLDVQAYGVSPLDESSEVRAFLNRWNPRGCLIARTDLWPVTLIELHKSGIPTYLFSATFSKGMKKTSWLSRKLLMRALPLLKKIFFVSVEDQNCCLQFYPQVQGQVLGDTRYDQVFFRLSQASAFEITACERLLIAGSTWPQDEAVLTAAAEKLLVSGWKWLWVPHEIHEEHLAALESQLKSSRLRSRRLSQMRGQLKSLNWLDLDVLIVDEVGLLASLYPLARLAFVGGSFRRQVHSVMEALAASCPVIVGPFHENSREALEFKEKGFVKSVSDPEDFVKAVEFLEKNLSQLRPALANEINAKGGATERLIQALEDEGLLPKNPSTSPQTN